MNKVGLLVLGAAVLLVGGLGLTAGETKLVTAVSAEILTSKELLGKFLFFDTNLSAPRGQSCATCHQPGTAFADPDHTYPVSVGVDEVSTGGRSAPPAAYAAYSPPFHFDNVEGLWFGGQFWDGRARDLVEQAKGPFLNPLEMKNTKEGVIQAVRASKYAWLFKLVYGPKSLNNVDSAYDQVADAIAAYEKTKEVSPFTSKYDYVLKGKATLTAQEARGLKIFTTDIGPGAGKCFLCHPVDTPAGAPGPLFTDFSYDNLGLPRNLEIPAYKANPALVDLGLGQTVGDETQNGKFKVSSLRNVALTAPYGHNGYFKTLKQIVHFYNTRDKAGENWPDPECAQNVNSDELGDLGLTDQEEDDLVAFLRTLTDGYVPR